MRPDLNTFRTMKPFAGVQKELLDALRVEMLICARGETLDLDEGKVYVMLEGMADELTPSIEQREAHVGFVHPGDSLGWYPISGCVMHRKRSVYAVLECPVGWCAWDWLQVKVDMVNRRLWDVRAQLALIKTTTVTERLRMDPPKPTERIVDVALRIGTTRRTIYSTLPKLEA
jgi:CRP-like cAMP-binding protein